MPSYSLIEYKLRRYLYLGHEFSIYVPPSIQTSFCERRHHDDVTGVRVIGKIVKKNKIEEINSIIPIILKIKKEGKLHDDRLLIFILAVCARFNLEQCSKMVNDAYEAIPEICTDGLKLLMFVNFCKKVNIILHDEGHLPTVPTGFSRRFRKALSKWYLNRDPLLTTEQIVRHKSYDGWTHKSIMNLIHIRYKNPSHQIFIVHTKYGMKKVEELFGSKLKDVQIDDKNETYENKQLKYIYNFLKLVDNMRKMDEKTLRNDIELRRWGHEFELVPKNMLSSTKILTSLVMHMPLRSLLENTLYFAKHKLFRNLTPDTGLWEFILRFNNTNELRKSRIHPIESFIEYVRYSRTSQNILEVQNNILKKLDPSTEPDTKLKVFIKKTNTDNKNYGSSISNTSLVKEDDSTTQTVVKPEFSQAVPVKLKNLNNQKCKNDKKTNLTSSSTSKVDSKSESENRSTKSTSKKSKRSSKETKSLAVPIVNSFEENEKEQKQNKFVDFLDIQQNDPNSNAETVIDTAAQSNDIDQNKLNIFALMKPPPRLVEQMLTFLSKDLLKKTLEILKPPGCRILIAYDSRMYLKKTVCACTRLLHVHEAISLVTLSLIYPDKLPNKPTILGLGVLEKQCNNEIIVDYSQSLTFDYLESILFKAPVTKNPNSDEKDISDVNPLTTMNWARENNKQYDVFVFLGTNKMNLKDINKTVKVYQTFLNKPVKVIVCCLNGKHQQQSNFKSGNMLFIAGFDKNVGKLIDSFINNEF